MISLESEEINTNGFPYVHGVPEFIYGTLLLPISEEECNDMLSELKNTKADIYIQININRLNNNRDELWEESALQKIRIIRYQSRVLQSVKQQFKSNRKLVINDTERLKIVEDKIASLTNKTEKQTKRIHDLENKVHYLENFVFKLLYHIDNKTLNELTSEYKEEINEVVRIIQLSPKFGKLIKSLKPQ